LQVIAHLHEVPKLMTEAASTNTNRTGFTNKLHKMIDEDGKLRSNFWATQVSTGRFCSSQPNLQNIPKTLEDGAINIRDCFIADPGHTFIDIDYSQIELRVAASLSREPVWLKAFHEGKSVHKETANAIFGLNHSDKEYKRAKTANFGILYGQTARAFSRMNNMSEIEAQLFIDGWYAAVPKVAEWIEKEKYHAWLTGYAETYFKRKRILQLNMFDSIDSEDKGIRAAWERKAISHIVQGTAADIMKIAIIRCHERIQKNNWPIQLLLTVHDEILFQTPDQFVDTAVPFLIDAMEFVIKDWVPITVDVEVGKRWGSLIDYNTWVAEKIGAEVF